MSVETVPTATVGARAPQKDQFARFSAHLMVLAAAVSPWNAVKLPGGLQPVDVTLVLALALLVLPALAGIRFEGPPYWVHLSGAGVAAVALSHAAAPLSPAYLGSRLHLVNFAGGVHVINEGRNLPDAGKWLVALWALPVLVVAVTSAVPETPRRMAGAFVLGNALSAAVALSDHLHVTSAALSLLGTVDVGGRESGLSAHPNGLGVGCAIAVPLAVWLSRSRPWVAHGCAGLLIAGCYLSGSRGAFVVGCAGSLAALLTYRRGRRLLATLGLALTTAGFAFRDTVTTTVATVATSVRLGGGDATASASDFGRRLIAGQAKTDFLTSPFRGIGIQVVTEAHSIPLQLAAAGGIVLLCAFALMAWGAMRAAWVIRWECDALGLMLCLSIGLWLTVGLVENQLTDRYLYIAPAIAAGLTGGLRLPRNQTITGGGRWSAGGLVVPDVRAASGARGPRAEGD